MQCGVRRHRANMRGEGDGEENEEEVGMAMGVTTRPGGVMRRPPAPGHRMLPPTCEEWDGDGDGEEDGDARTGPF